MKFKQLVLTSIMTFFTYSTFAQSKIPEPKTDSYSINQFEPNSNGSILANLLFNSKVVLNQPQRDQFAWEATISFKRANVVGYKYNGVTYSKEQLLNDFGVSDYSLSDDIKLQSVTITFNNGKSFKANHLGLRGFDYSSLVYNKGDEDSDFKINKISILSTTNVSIESKIKDGLAKKETLKNKEAISKNSETETVNKNSNNSSPNTSNTTNSSRSLSELIIGTWVITGPTSANRNGDRSTVYFSSNGTGYMITPDSDNQCYPYYWKNNFTYSINNSRIIERYTSIDVYCGKSYSLFPDGFNGFVINSSGDTITDAEGYKYTKK
jgi:hypothetical protein